MGTFVFVYLGFVAVIGLAIAGVVALRPKLFWPMLIVVVVGAAGLTMPGSVGLIDEYLTGCVLIGGLLAISIGAISLRRQPRDDLSYFHILMFSLLIVYMIVESIRGLLLWEDFRLSRWVIYFAMLGMLSFITNTGSFPVPNVKRISLIVVLSLLVYYSAYLMHGFYAEEFRGISKYALTIQGNEWAGPAYAVFPLVVGIPAAIFLLKDAVPRQRWLGGALIITALLVGYYYDCRSAWITVLAFLIVSPTVLRFRRTGVWMLIIAGLAFFVFNYSAAVFQRFLQSALLQDVGEAGRLMMFKAGVNAWSADWIAFFFGYGMHSHHFVIGQSLQALGYYGFGSAGSSYVRVSGFPGMLVDTGLIGMLLLSANFLLTGLKVIVSKKSPGRIVLLLTVLLSFAWLTIIDIDDIILLWFMIMPSGLLVQLSRGGAAEQPLKKAN